MNKDMAASVRQRLTNKAKARNQPFQEILQYFAMERFLYRLAQSKQANQFTLKGALMFTAWGGPTSRPTKDIDLLARMDNDVESVVAVMREVCQQKVEDDGLTFDVESVKGAVIKEDADYSGVRITFLAKLQNARVPMQIDIGFGDVVTPASEKTNYPVLLDFAAPQLQGYPRETVVAEKFEAMTKLGMLNSRMKDFYDIWLLSRQFNFEGTTLATAIQRTFANRSTIIVDQATALTATFGSDAAKQVQWQAFLKKTHLHDVPTVLQEVINSLESFLIPVAKTAISKTDFVQHWVAPGPWQNGKTAAKA